MPTMPVGTGLRNPGMVPFRGSLGGNPLLGSLGGRNLGGNPLLYGGNPGLGRGLVRDSRLGL